MHTFASLGKTRFHGGCLLQSKDAAEAQSTGGRASPGSDFVFGVQAESVAGSRQLTSSIASCGDVVDRAGEPDSRRTRHGNGEKVLKEELRTGEP
jgi:hypothetical protein